LQQQKLQAEALQAEKDNKEYHVDAAITAFPEEHRDTIKKMWQMSGLVGADGIMRGKDIRSTPDLYKKYPDMALATNMTEIEKIEKEQASLAKKGDPVSQAKILENAGTLTDLHKKNAFLRGKEPQKPNVYKPGDYVEQPGGGYQQMPKEQEVKDNYVLPSGDSVTLMKDGTFLNEDGSAYDGDRSVLRKVGSKDDMGEVSPTIVKTFEAAHPELADKRGTPEYGEALQAFIKSGERPYSTFVGTTPDGKYGITHDTRSNTFGIQPLPAGGNLQPKVSPTIPVEQTTALQQIGTLKEALSQVTNLYEDSFVGPIAGPVGKKQDNWGVMPNAKRAEFRALTANLYNTIIYLRSGKQINEEEAKRLMDELPTMNISPVGFQAKLKKFTWELNSIERGKLRQLKGAGYRNVGEPQGVASPDAGGGTVKVWDPATKSFKVK
jgi:hypothetical protein